MAILERFSQVADLPGYLSDIFIYLDKVIVMNATIILIDMLPSSPLGMLCPP